MKERTQFNYAQRWRIERSGQQQALKKRKRGILWQVLLALTVAVVLILPWIWQYKLKYSLEKVEEQILSYQEVAAALEEIEWQKAEIARMESFLGISKANAKDPKAVLLQISSLLPAGTIITSYSLQADYSVQIGVVLEGPVDLAELWKRFSDSGLFLDFDLNTVSLTDESKTLSLSLKMKQ